MLECPTMVRRAPALLLLIYVALDFANPLMPGAVNFDAASSVEAVRPERTARAAVAAVPAAPPSPVVPGLVPAAAPRPAHPVGVRPTRRLAAPPRSAPAAETPAQSGDDA